MVSRSFCRAVSLVAILVMGANAHAADKDKDQISEFNHHAMGGWFEITPSYTKFDSVAQPRDLTTIAEIENSGSNVGLKLEYGLLPRLGIGLKAEQIERKVTVRATTPIEGYKQKGLSDISAFARGSTSGIFKLIYGLGVDYSHEKSKETSDGVYNSTTGGTTIYPNLGFEVGGHGCTFGIVAEYTMYTKRTFVDYAGDVTTTTGGNGYTGVMFIEIGMGPVKLGLGERYGHYEGTESQDSSGESGNADDHTVSEFFTYLPIQIGKHLTIIPSFNSLWQKFTNRESSTFTSTDESQRLALRFSF